MSAIEEPSEQTAASLVSGIVGDLQQLVERQFQLTRQEIEQELRQRTSPVMIVVVGVAVLFLGAIVICQALALLLYWAASPSGTDSEWLSLWACNAIVACILAVIAGLTARVGRTRFKSAEKIRNPVTEIL